MKTKTQRKPKATGKQATKGATKRREVDPFACIQNVADFFVWYRTRAGLTQRELAQSLGVTPAYIAQVELDEYRSPLSLCRALAKHLTAPEKQKLLAMLRENITLDLEPSGHTTLVSRKSESRPSAAEMVN